MTPLKTVRNSNIELLRVIAMLMIVTLHYFNQGGILDAAVYGESNYAVAWLTESFCYISVNIYVLISGWMLSACTSPVKWGKVIHLVLQVVFYSVGIYAVCCLFGVCPFNIKTLITGYLFPFIHGEYWFATVYVVLYVLSPFLNKAITALSRKEHQWLLIILGIVFSVIPTLFFFAGNSVGVNGGYSLVWFVFLYLLASYLRKYELRFSQRWLLPIFFGACLMPFGMKIVQQALLGKELFDWYRYTSSPVLIGSIALFMFFIQFAPRQNRLWATLGSTTFGVFLIHTQYLMRDTLLWKQWVQPLKHYYMESGTFLLHLLLSVLLIFIGCSVIDWVREKLFSLIAAWCRPLTDKLSSRFQNPLS